MESKTRTYESPVLKVITLEAEQYFLTGSGKGSNEDLYDDVNDYSDYFE